MIGPGVALWKLLKTPPPHGSEVQIPPAAASGGPGLCWVGALSPRPCHSLPVGAGPKLAGPHRKGKATSCPPAVLASQARAGSRALAPEEGVSGNPRGSLGGKSRPFQRGGGCVKGGDFVIGAKTQIPSFQGQGERLWGVWNTGRPGPGLRLRAHSLEHLPLLYGFEIRRCLFSSQLCDSQAGDVSRSPECWEPRSLCQ